MPILLPERVFLEQDPGVTLARPVLGLHLYLRDGAAWAATHAPALLARFLQSVPHHRLFAYRSSAIGRYRRLDPGEVPRLPEELRIGLGAYGGRGLRDFFLFELVDEAGAPSLAFRYREIDDRRTGQQGWIQLLFDPRSEPQELLALLIEAAQSAPLWAAIGGYTASWHPELSRSAFKVLYGWCKRWLGLGLHQPDEASFTLATGLPEVSWLTYVSDAAAARWEIQAPLAELPFSARVQAVRLREGTLIKAGPAPALGDLNQGEFPSALAEASQVLGPYLSPLRHELPGRFAEEGATQAWRERFRKPEGWA